MMTDNIAIMATTYGRNCLIVLAFHFMFKPMSLMFNIVANSKIEMT